MQRILITGTNGLLGQKLVYLLLERNLTNAKQYQIIATSRGENRLVNKKGYQYFDLDITNESEVQRVFTQTKPHVVINTAAMTNVDQCEKERKECDMINVDAVAYQIRTLEKLQHAEKNYRPHFIHLSTDFVYDGEAGPYRETDKPNPISYYGHSKFKADLLVEESSINWAIVRTIIVYGVVDNMSRSNLVLWAKSALQKGDKINVINDQFRAPTLAEDLAEGCMLIADKKATGIYNISGRDTYSILDLVYQIADFWQLDKSLIQVVSSTTLNQPAKRPPRTGFILDKAINQLGYKPKSFREGLNIIDKQLKGFEK
jgi:dTDP-4-dehydrorhamnose reductase